MSNIMSYQWCEICKYESKILASTHHLIKPHFLVSVFSMWEYVFYVFYVFYVGLAKLHCGATLPLLTALSWDYALWQDNVKINAKTSSILCTSHSKGCIVPVCHGLLLSPIRGFPTSLKHILGLQLALRVQEPISCLFRSRSHVSTILLHK